MYYAAGVAINFYEKKQNINSITQSVLAELVKRSDHGSIGKPNLASTDICKKLKISGESYRQATAKLRKLGIISKNKAGTLIIAKIIETPFTQFTLTEPWEK